MIDPAIQISEGKRGLSSRLYNDLLNSIITGDLPRGSHLPTEHQLSEDYGVSRTTVRAALARLKEEGYIESKQGSGTYVAEDPHISDMKPFAPVESLRDLEKCFECRLVVEGEIAGLAAERRTDEDVTYFAEHLKEMHALVGQGEIHTMEDTSFHVRLSEITQNRFFHEIMTSIRPHMLFSMNISKTLMPNNRDRHATLSIEEHEAIVKAIIAGDPDKAREAMRNHVIMAKGRIFDGA